MKVSYTAVRKALLREKIPLRKRNTVGLHKANEETRSKLRQAKLGRNNPNHLSKLSKREVRRLRERLAEIRPKQHSVQTIRKMSETRVRLGLSAGDRNPMRQPKAAQKWAASNNLKPNRAETRLLTIINTVVPGAYACNVLGDLLVVKGKIPDFVNVVGKRKVIELFGDYWHRGEDPSLRIQLFRDVGYDALIVWERELNDIERLCARLKSFDCEIELRL